jgi:hypothetical protein
MNEITLGRMVLRAAFGGDCLIFRYPATNAWGSVRMLLQRKHTIMRWKDLSVQLAGTALLVAVARNEFMPTQGVLLKRGWACRYVVQ